MIRMIKNLLLAAVLLLGVSCTKDTIESGGVLPPTPEGYVRASLAMSVSENEQVNTRATDIEEKAYDDAYVWVLMFKAVSASDATPTTLLQAPIKANKTGAQLYALLRATTQPVTIYVATGLTASMNTYLGDATNFVENSTTYADISTQLQTEAVTETGVPVGGTNPVRYIPMCTDAIAYTTGIVSLSQITVSFNRIVAKVDVDAERTMADFTLESLTLINGAQKGLVLPQEPLVTNNGGTPVQYSEVSSVDRNKILSQIYLYENNGVTNPTKVIVKGKYKGGASGYYRMDLHKEIAGSYTPYDIERNKCYTITVTEIQNGGYPTFAEALTNQPSNAAYTVTVTNPDAHDIVSNGEYYIGVSNSEFVVYGDGELRNQLAVTVIHNANSSTVSTNNISVSGGLTAITTNLTADTNTSDKKTDVLVTLPESFTTAMTGMITIKLGNLTKTIKVTRKAQLSAIGSVVADFSDRDYVSGVIESAGTANWLKLSANADGSNPTSVANKPIVSLSGGIYFSVSDNLSASGGSNRTGGSFFVFHRINKGRVRVVVHQGFANMGNAVTNPLPYPYVGAFWRGDQTGERLIRMPVNANNLGAWSAVVMDGADWVVLDTQNSTDPNIGWKAGANESLVADMNTADASYQVSGSATSVSGTALADTDYIYFRIGLKSRLSVISAPRYARVGVTYNNNTKIQILYLRQGEAADYLFRPTDPYGNSPAGVSAPIWRPEATKFSPYNLTDPNMGVGGGDISDHNQLSLQSASAGENRFTAYPSQAGAFFQWAGTTGQERYAYHPTNPLGNIASMPTHSTAYWSTLSATNETCPLGYRRPNDGIIDGDNSAGLVSGSEYRQSLYLNPKARQGGSTGTLVNTLWGYYADGFFDRRHIQNSSSPNSSSNSVVSNNDKNVAYVGCLFFNPTTSASIFFSAPGYRYSNLGKLAATGTFGLYWSSSTGGGPDLGWLLDLSRSEVAQYYSGKDVGYCVRCVVASRYTVNFSVNGGGGTPPLALNITPGSSITLPRRSTAIAGLGSMIPPVGSVLIGWSTTPDGASVGMPGATYIPTANVTLYAVWSTTTVLRITLGKDTNESPMLVLTDDPNDLGLYFKWGSLVGTYGGAEGDPYDVGDVAYDPRTDTPNITAWADIPFASSFPDQSVANKNLALGDPCRLVGLHKRQIELGTVDNGTYRLPTDAEHAVLIGRASSWYTPADLNPGRRFLSIGAANNWYPAAGSRSDDGTLYQTGRNGYYWSSSAINMSEGWYLSFTNAIANHNSNLNNGGNLGYTVRCVPQ